MVHSRDALIPTEETYEPVLVLTDRNGLRLIDFTLTEMQACGSWDRETMERVCDNIRPVVAHLLEAPVLAPWADDDARWDEISEAWQAYANPLCDEAGNFDFTELGAVVQIAVNKALGLATPTPSQAQDGYGAARSEAECAREKSNG